MTPTSALVIGRGIIGLSTAFELSEHGWRISVVGPDRLPGSASRAAVGISSLKGQIQASKPLFAAKIQGHEALRPWLRRIEAASGRCVRQDFSGVLEPFFSVTEFEGIRERVFHRTFSGGLNVQLRAPTLLKEKAQVAPSLGQARGAFHYTRDGWFDPEACLAALECALRRRGVAFVDAPATRIRPSPTQGLVVETEAGPLLSDEVVVAAGIFSDDLLDRSGLALVRQELVSGETLRGTLPSPTASLLLRRGKVNYAVHDGIWAVGSTSRRVPRFSDCSLGSEATAELTAFSQRDLGPSAFLSAAEAVWGVRGRYRDRAPALGPLFFESSPRRVWVALGFYKNGLQLAPLFSRYLAALMTGQSAISELAPFSVARLQH